jgi:hypothetical protein
VPPSREREATSPAPTGSHSPMPPSPRPRPRRRALRRQERWRLARSNFRWRPNRLPPCDASKLFHSGYSPTRLGTLAVT